MKIEVNHYGSRIATSPGIFIQECPPAPTQRYWRLDVQISGEWMYYTGDAQQVGDLFDALTRPVTP